MVVERGRKGNSAKSGVGSDGSRSVSCCRCLVVKD